MSPPFPLFHIAQADGIAYPLTDPTYFHSRTRIYRYPFPATPSQYFERRRRTGKREGAENRDEGFEKGYGRTKG